MSELLFIGTCLVATVLLFAAIGALLLWRRSLRARQLGGFALLAACLTGLIGYGLVQRSAVSDDISGGNLLSCLALVVAVTYLLMRICLDLVLGSLESSEHFQESSVLSMFAPLNPDNATDFEPTQLLSSHESRGDSA